MAKSKVYCKNCSHWESDHKGSRCSICMVLLGISCDRFESGKVEILKEDRPPRALVIHIVPVDDIPARGPAMCGATKGRAGNPDIATLVVDRWCSRCWKKWARQKEAASEAYALATRGPSAVSRGPEPAYSQGDRVQLPASA